MASYMNKTPQAFLIAKNKWRESKNALYRHEGCNEPFAVQMLAVSERLSYAILGHSA